MNNKKAREDVLTLEYNSANFYKNIMDDITPKDEKSFLQALYDVELEHIEIIKHALDFMERKEGENIDSLLKTKTFYIHEVFKTLQESKNFEAKTNDTTFCRYWIKQ